MENAEAGVPGAEAGSLIGPWQSYADAYHPEHTSLTGVFPASVVSTISVTSATIGVIGFEVNLYSYLNYGGWTAGPHDVAILV